MIFYITLWFPAAYLARIVGWFMFAIPISTVIGPTIFGVLRDKMGNDFYAVLFLALLSVVAFALVLLIGHYKRAELGAKPVTT